MVSHCFPHGFDSAVISRAWSRDSSALEFILPRSRSRDQKAKVSVLVSRPEGPGLCLGLKTWWPRSRFWSRDLKKGLTTTLGFHTEFSFSWWAALPHLIPHHTVSYIQPHDMSKPAAYSKPGLLKCIFCCCAVLCGVQSNRLCRRDWGHAHW